MAVDRASGDQGLSPADEAYRLASRSAKSGVPPVIVDLVALDFAARLIRRARNSGGTSAESEEGTGDGRR